MDWSAPKLKDECDAADRLRDKIIESLDERLERYYGEAYGYSDGEYWPENYYFTWVSYILPQLVFQNPRVKVGSLRTEDIAGAAKGLELALNRWIRDTDHRQHLRHMGFDMGFGWGVSFTRPTPVPGRHGSDIEDVPWRPQCERVNPRLYALDPSSDGPWNARYQTHTVIDDKDKMLEWAKEHPEEGWNKKAIEQSGGVAAYELTKSKADDVPDRGQTAYRVIWCPEENGYLGKEDDPADYWGTIYTLSLNPSSSHDIEWIREPYPFMGPRWGPYTLFGAYGVPGCPYPLSPLTANDAQFKEVNAIALANYEKSRNAKTVGVYDKAYEGEAAAFFAAKHGSTVGITGFEKAKWDLAKIEGMDTADLMQEEHARQMAERGIGINAVQQGQIETNSLATEIMQASAASNVRTADLAEQMNAATKRELSTAAFYMWRFDKVQIPLTQEDKAMMGQRLGLPPEAIAQLIKLPLRWSGKDNVGSFDDMELEIEPYSMKRTDEPMMQARALQGIQVYTQIAPAIVQFPWMPWKKTLERLGDALNWPGFGEYDEQMAAAYSAINLQSMLTPPQPTTGDPKVQPRMGGDLPKPPQQSFAKAGGPTKKPMGGAKPKAKAGAY